MSSNYNADNNKSIEIDKNYEICYMYSVFFFLHWVDVLLNVTLLKKMQISSEARKKRRQQSTCSSIQYSHIFNSKLFFIHSRNSYTQLICVHFIQPANMSPVCIN